MPIKEYQCLKCEHVWETILGVDEEAKECPECGGEPERKVASHGGYFMNSGPSSVRPRGAGSFKRKK
jgi:putative FmdB family regulatory protein